MEEVRGIAGMGGNGGEWYLVVVYSYRVRVVFFWPPPKFLWHPA